MRGIDCEAREPSRVAALDALFHQLPIVSERVPSNEITKCREREKQRDTNRRVIE